MLWPPMHKKRTHSMQVVDRRFQKLIKCMVKQLISALATLLDFTHNCSHINKLYKQSREQRKKFFSQGAPSFLSQFQQPKQSRKK